MRFRLLNGKHTELRRRGKKKEEREVGRSYKVGDVVESDRPLNELYANKFERLPDEEPTEVRAARKKAEKAGKLPNPNPPKPELDPEHVYDQDDETSASISSELGENVTADFPKAVEANLLVLCDEDEKYHVADPDDPDEALNDKPLSKGQCDKFISKQLKNG